MSFKWNSRFKSNRVQHDYSKKRIQNFENRKCKFDGRKCNSNQKWNIDASPKNNIYAKKIILGILLHVAVKMVKMVKYYWQFSDHVSGNYRRGRSKKYFKKCNLWSNKFICFTCLFINYYSIIDRA